MGGRPGSRGWIGNCLLIPWLLLPGGSAEGQSTLLSARVEVTLPPTSETVRVLETFSLLPDEEEEEIPISVLSPEPSHLSSLQALVAGRILVPSDDAASDFRLNQVRRHFWEGRIRIPPELRGGGDSLILQISYLVEGAWEEDGRATIPILVPRWVPGNPLPRTFVARVDVPKGLTITGSFPTSVLNRPRKGEAGNYEIALQGVPAMLILRTATGRTPFLTLELGLDLMVVLSLVVMGALGASYLRGHSR